MFLAKQMGRNLPRCRGVATNLIKFVFQENDRIGKIVAQASLVPCIMKWRIYIHLPLIYLSL